MQKEDLIPQKKTVDPNLSKNQQHISDLKDTIAAINQEKQNIDGFMDHPPENITDFSVLGKSVARLIAIQKELDAKRAVIEKEIALREDREVMRKKKLLKSMGDRKKIHGSIKELRKTLPALYTNGKVADPCLYCEKAELALMNQTLSPEAFIQQTPHIGGHRIENSYNPQTFSTDIKIGNSIKIQGTPEYKATMLLRLQKIATTESGLKLLNSIEKSGKQLVIKTTDENMADPCSYPNPTTGSLDDAHPKGVKIYSKGVVTDRKGTGKGSDMSVRVNPNYELVNPKDRDNPMPPDAILFHEMVHASHGMNAELNLTPMKGYDNIEEFNTITAGNPSERTYLQERGYPWYRTDHALTFEPFG